MSAKRDVVYWVERMDEELNGGRKLTDEEMEEMLAYKFSPGLSGERAKAFEKLKIEWEKMKKRV